MNIMRVGRGSKLRSETQISLTTIVKRGSETLSMETLNILESFNYNSLNFYYRSLLSFTIAKLIWFPSLFNFACL